MRAGHRLSADADSGDYYALRQLLAEDTVVLCNPIEGWRIAAQGKPVCCGIPAAVRDRRPMAATPPLEACEAAYRIRIETFVTT